MSRAEATGLSKDDYNSAAEGLYLYLFLTFAAASPARVLMLFKKRGQ